MKTLFSFSRRDRNGLMLFLLLMVAASGVATLFNYRSTLEKQKEQEFLISSSRYLAELQVVGIELPSHKTVKIPVEMGFNKPIRKNVAPQNPNLPKVELNTADSAALVALPGIGKVFAARILKYRSMLGGFFSTEQLLEVYGLDVEKYERLKDRITADTSHIVKFDINKGEFKAILKHPYIDYDMTKRIFKARNEKSFDDFNDLSLRASIPDSVIIKVEHYIVF